MAKSLALSCFLYGEKHGHFPHRLDIPEIKQLFGLGGQATNYFYLEVWPLVRYRPPDSVKTSNDFFMAYPTRGGWICLRTNFTAEFRRDLPEWANNPDASDAAITPQFQFEHHQHGVGDAAKGI
jgi:hypothetical protein